MNKIIEIKCKGSRCLPYTELKNFQGDLKELIPDAKEKLKNSILELGWITPIFVWKKDIILDGHGRLIALLELIDDGYTIGDIPVVDIDAKSKKEAAKILLSINSQYQEITDDGLKIFLTDFDLQLEDLGNIELPGIDLSEAFGNFNLEDGIVKEKEVDEDLETENECPKCRYKW